MRRGDQFMWFVVILAFVAVAFAIIVNVARAGVHWKLWQCVHRQEHSAWNDPNEPYWGGLQMSMWFQQTYAPDLLRRYGTADHWPPVVQMWAAEHAYKIEHYSHSWLETQWPPSVGVCF